MEIHQLLAGFDYGDAISDYALELKDIFRSWGYPSHIYGEHINPILKKNCSFYPEHRSRSSSQNIIVFHFSIGSSISRYFANLPDKKIMIYHNITPPQFFQGFDHELAQFLKEGREDLALLKDIPHLALGDSPYNCAELKKFGYKNVGSLPVIINFKKFEKKPTMKIMKFYKDNFINFLSVGRVIPNKKCEDIIKTFYYYTKYINSHARLFLVGPYNKEERYFIFLKNLLKKFQIEEKVIFTGRVKLETLIAYYRLAHLYLCLSEHEGFCIPLLESMFFEVPIIAYKAGAIPWTLNGAGILLEKKRYAEIAEIAHLIVSQEKLKQELIEKGKVRLSDFARVKIEKKLKEYINEADKLK